MKFGHGSVRLALLAAALASAPLACLGGPQDSPLSVQPVQGPVQLEIRFGSGPAKFHSGEIITIELTFTSTERKVYRISAESPPTELGEYHVDPAGFTNRELESNAAGQSHIRTGHGFTSNVDPGEKPVTFVDTLNRLFRMRKPGRYLVYITSRRLGFPVTSNAEELEILPSDTTWEAAELARGVGMIESETGKPAHDKGCDIVGSLGTVAAALEMARLYALRGECEETFQIGLINASDRTAVLARLEDGFRNPTRSIDVGLLRTLAYVRTYQQHPDWYLAPVDESASLHNSRFIPPGVISDQELSYARLLVSNLSQKSPEARAFSLKMLLYLSQTLENVEIPEEIRRAVREQMPTVFDKLPDLDQGYVLQHRWHEVKSLAMIPVLKQIVDGPPGRQSTPLRRLYELSPDTARPYLLRELRLQSPRVEGDVLSLLPEKELPDLDEIMLERVRERFQYGDYSLALATGIVQRYASAAIADSLRALLLNNGIGKMECQSEANLLAYFLRVAPADGTAMLRQELSIGRPGCQILARLATVRFSSEVEVAALDSLHSTNAEIVREALQLLQRNGSPEIKETLLRDFRQWHDKWGPRTHDLERPENRERLSIDVDYFTALGAAYGWLYSMDDLRTLKELCVTSRCKEEATGRIGYWESTQFTVQVAGPVGDEVAERVGMPRYFGVLDTMERLEHKLAQFPKGSVFALDARSAERELIERVYAELKPWATEHGFDLVKQGN